MNQFLLEAAKIIIACVVTASSVVVAVDARIKAIEFQLIELKTIVKLKIESKE
jgi:hypothetical protein